MKRNLSPVYLCFLALATLSYGHSLQDGQVQIQQEASIRYEPNLDKVAKDLSKQIDKAKIKSVVVADFLSPNGDSIPQGKFLADDFSERIDYFRKKFKVLERRKLSLSPKDLETQEGFQRIGQFLSVDAVVTGTITTSPDEYRILLTLKSTKKESPPISEEQQFARPSYLDRFDIYSDPTVKAGVNGVSIPECEYCPDATYSDIARASKYQGTVVLQLVVTPEGRGTNFVIIKRPGYGLAERAAQAASTWRFHPSLDKNGKPVAAVVPVEITFRFY